jgi:hypothetical protein
MVSHETVQMGSQLELTYQVQLKKDVSTTAFMEKLRILNENFKVQLYYPDQEITI